MNIDIKIELAREDKKECVVYISSICGPNTSERFKTKRELTKILSDYVKDMVFENVELTEV